MDARELLAALPPLSAPNELPNASREALAAVADYGYHHGPAERLHETRPLPRSRWRTVRIDDGRMLHPEADILGWTPGRGVAPKVLDWGVQLTLANGPSGWTPLHLDKRKRLLVPPHLRAHLGITADDTVLTARRGQVLDLVAAHVVEDALGLVPPC